MQHSIARRRRSAIWMIAVLLLSILVPPTTRAKSTDTDYVLEIKSGACKMSLLDSNGVTPLADKSVVMASTKDDSAIAKATSDKLGKCSLDLKPGKYILRIEGRNMAIIKVADSAKITECRIVVPESELQVGSQGSLLTYLLSNTWLVAGVVATAIAVPVAVNNTSLGGSTGSSSP